MALTESELIEKKNEIENAKSELDSLKGQKKVYESQLKKDWDCDTLKDGKRKLKKMQNDADELDKEIATELEELEEKYFTDED